MNVRIRVLFLNRIEVPYGYMLEFEFYFSIKVDYY